MKVLLLAENWPPRVGGIERYLTGLAAALPTGSVTVVAPAGDESAGEGGVTVIRRRFFWPFIRPRWLPLYFWLSRLMRREKFDAVLCGKALFEGLAAQRLVRRRGTRYVVLTYGMEIETWAGSRRERRKLVRVLTGADRVGYINTETKKLLRDLGVQEAQLVEALPGVQEQFFRAESEERIAATARRYGISRPYILTVARLIPRKGVDILIEAFSQLDQTRFGEFSLVIVGDGPEKGKLQELSRQLFVQKSVVFTGSVSEAELSALYQGAIVFALTPRQIENDIEGFGIVYLEAAASNKAAVATNTGGITGAVIDGQTGLIVAPDSAKAVKNALETLLSDAALRDRLGRQGGARARQEFSWRERIAPIIAAIDTAGGQKV